VVRDDQPDAREGQAGRRGETERFAVPLKPGNAGGRDLSSRRAQYVVRTWRLGNLSTPNSVQKLQKALHAKAKAEADYRFYALYDKISREDILAHAYAQCRSNKGAPGVDGQDFADITEGNSCPEPHHDGDGMGAEARRKSPSAGWLPPPGVPCLPPNGDAGRGHVERVPYRGYAGRPAQGSVAPRKPSSGLG